MIPIHRGREPGGLKPIRTAELARVRPLVAANTLTPHNINSAYNVFRGRLCRSQYSKCCCCERNNLEAVYLPVEHFRPKLQARHGPGFPPHNGYWWLTWTWKNLLFSCQPCNSSFKRTEFPLDVGSAPLVAEDPPPGKESPLLIDPASENPIGHIKFTLHPNLPWQRWRPLPRNGSPRGNFTIHVLGLSRPALLDLYENHVNVYLTPALNRLRAAMVANDAVRVRAIWRNEVLAWLDPRTPFTGLSYDVFDHHVPPAERRLWRLPLPRPR